MADLFGKEDALVTTSGCLSNCISAMIMAPNHGMSLIVGSNSHYLSRERGMISSVAGAMPTTLQNMPDGTLDIEEIRRELGNKPDAHLAPIGGVALESSHNGCSGRVLKPQYVDMVKKVTKKHKVHLYLDGARAWNAAVFL